MFHFGFFRAFGGSRPGVFGAVAAVVVALLAPPIMVAQAHEGHDHGPSEFVTGPLAPRVSARSENFELVGILRGERLIIYLDRFATNEPVTTADIAVTIGDAAEAVNAEWAAEGTYALTMPRLQSAGPIELVFSITGEAGEDLLAGTLTVPQNAAVVTPALSVIERLRIWFTSLVSSGDGPTGAATNPSVVDSPRRLPDGHVFVRSRRSGCSTCAPSNWCRSAATDRGSAIRLRFRGQACLRARAQATGVLCRQFVESISAAVPRRASAAIRELRAIVRRGRRSRNAETRYRHQIHRRRRRRSPCGTPTLG